MRTPLLALLVLAGSAPAAAQAPDTAAVAGGGRLVVGVADAPPFAFQGAGGAWDGVAVYLWRQVADSLDLVYDLREVPADALLDGLADGTLDVALTTAATAEAVPRVDFAPIYYASSLGVAGMGGRSLWTIARSLLSARFFRVVLWLSLLLLAVGALVWLAERKKNESDFGGDRRWYEGLGVGFWWAGVTMTTIGYGDKAPKTIAGRTLALLWMLVAMAITASLTAALVSIVGSGESSISIPNDLRRQTVGTVGGTAAAAYLEQERVRFRSFDTPGAGLRALQNDSLDAFVYAAPVLRYLINETDSLTARVQTTGVRPHRYAFALPEGSPLEEPLSHGVLATINTDTWQGVLDRYMPE